MNGNQLHGLLGAAWGIFGLSLLLLGAIVRLGEISWDIVNYQLTWYHWAIAIANILFMAYTEGYKGFQLKFSPRFAARCLYLRHNPKVLHTLLAPLFCMGFFYTTRRRMVATLVLTLVIIGFIKIAHMLTQPWRGILDAGVVVGLTWGLISVYYYLLQAFRNTDFNYSPELPPQASNPA